MLLPQTHRGAVPRRQPLGRLPQNANAPLRHREKPCSSSSVLPPAIRYELDLPDAGNLYCPRDNFDPSSSHVIPALIRKCLEAKQRGDDHIVCWGDGSPTREFLYAAEALALAAERYDKPAPVNLGGGGEISIRDLVEMIARPCDYTGEITWDTTKPNGQPRRHLDGTRAFKELGFRPGTSLEDGLRETITWYREHGK